MKPLVFLDSEPLGLASQAFGKPRADRCRRWISDLEARGWEVVVPEIVDYELRRELTRVGATAGLSRLEAFLARHPLVQINRTTMLRACELWARVRRQGLPTAHHHSLDADAILAAQALVTTGGSSPAIVATSNARHLSRFEGVEARNWDAWADSFVWDT